MKIQVTAKHIKQGKKSRVTMLSINPDAATREDIANMAAELVEIWSRKPEAGETPETDALLIDAKTGRTIIVHGETFEALEKLCRSLELRLRALLRERNGMVMVPKELLILWHRVMLQSPGEYEERCAAEMGELLARPHDERKE